MADDTNFRSYRPNDPYGRNANAPGQGARGGANDPLEELARLIGQSDPFADMGRDRIGGSVRRPAQQAPSDHGMDWPPPDAGVPGYRRDAFSAPHAPHPAQLSDHPPFEARQSGFQQQYNPAAYGSAQTGIGNFGGEAYYDGPAHAPQGDEGYDDDVAEKPRRRGLRMVMVLAGLALLGTGGAFAYRAIFSGGSANTPPPVIKADTAPSKVAATQGEASNKLIYDRVGDTAQGEKIVSREERPVNVGDSSRPGPRVVFPPLTSSSERDGPTAMATPLGGIASVGPASAEPKKIRTVAIRPDQPLDAGGAKSSATPPQPRGNPLASVSPSTTANTPPAPQTRSASTLSLPPAGTALPPPAGQTSAAGPAPASAMNAPLSLSPASSPDTASRAASPASRVAALPPAPPPSRSAPLSTAPEAMAGSYTVQLSSQRSEPEAQASFRALQTKFPNLLSDRQPIIRRADLGDKGIYFRAMVGGFASVDQATEFCGSLKSAGGQCVVQRN